MFVAALATVDARQEQCPLSLRSPNSKPVPAPSSLTAASGPSRIFPGGRFRAVATVDFPFADLTEPTGKSFRVRSRMPSVRPNPVLLAPMTNDERQFPCLATDRQLTLMVYSSDMELPFPSVEAFPGFDSNNSVHRRHAPSSA